MSSTLDAKTTYDYDREYVIHSWSVQSKRNPLVVNRAEGVYFWGTSFPSGKEKKYLDMASQLVNSNIGHQHPKVVAVIKEQADKLCFAAPSFANEKRSELAKLLSEVAPAGLKCSFFTNAGADANENAIKIARMFTKKTKIITRYRSYHGATYGAIALTGDPRRPPVEPTMPGVVRVLDPYCYRCPFGQKESSCHLECAKQIEEVIMYENPDTVAAVMIESVTGSNGVFIPPKAYYEEVRRICDKNKVLFIADEVMAGFGRAGTWFAIQNFGVSPDIMTVAKGINSGYVPLGAVIMSEKVAAGIKDDFLYCGLTYSGHPLACAAAVATIKAYKDEKIIENSAKMGKVLSGYLAEMKKKHPSVGDVRNIGLFGVLELVKDRGTKEPIVPWNSSGPVMTAVNDYLMEKGVFLYSRWNYMFIVPPIIINEKQMADAFEVIDGALALADASLGK
jgi:taurine---2-oxoglutarate transaminase